MAPFSKKHSKLSGNPIPPTETKDSRCTLINYPSASAEGFFLFFGRGFRDRDDELDNDCATLLKINTQLAQV
jgi:hypothetical protein